MEKVQNPKKIFHPGQPVLQASMIPARGPNSIIQYKLSRDSN